MERLDLNCRQFWFQIQKWTTESIVTHPRRNLFSLGSGFLIQLDQCVFNVNIEASFFYISINKKSWNSACCWFQFWKRKISVFGPILKSLRKLFSTKICCCCCCWRSIDAREKKDFPCTYLSSSSFFVLNKQIKF